MKKAIIAMIALPLALITLMGCEEKPKKPFLTDVDVASGEYYLVYDGVLYDDPKLLSEYKSQVFTQSTWMRSLPAEGFSNYLNLYRRDGRLVKSSIRGDNIIIPNAMRRLGKPLTKVEVYLSEKNYKARLAQLEAISNIKVEPVDTFPSYDFSIPDADYLITIRFPLMIVKADTDFSVKEVLDKLQERLQSELKEQGIIDYVIERKRWRKIGEHSDFIASTPISTAQLQSDRQKIEELKAFIEQTIKTLQAHELPADWLSSKTREDLLDAQKALAELEIRVWKHQKTQQIVLHEDYQTSMNPEQLIALPGYQAYLLTLQLRCNQVCDKKIEKLSPLNWLESEVSHQEVIGQVKALVRKEKFFTGLFNFNPNKLFDEKGNDYGLGDGYYYALQNDYQLSGFIRHDSRKLKLRWYIDLQMALQGNFPPELFNSDKD